MSPTLLCAGGVRFPHHICPSYTLDHQGQFFVELWTSYLWCWIIWLCQWRTFSLLLGTGTHFKFSTEKSKQPCCLVTDYCFVCVHAVRWLTFYLLHFILYITFYFKSMCNTLSDVIFLFIHFLCFWMCIWRNSSPLIL